MSIYKGSQKIWVCIKIQKTEVRSVFTDTLDVDMANIHSTDIDFEQLYLFVITYKCARCFHQDNKLIVIDKQSIKSNT